MNSAFIVTGLIFLMLFSIVSSLGLALYYLLFDEAKTKRAARTLLWRIVLSLILFMALFVAFGFGWITPHPLASREDVSHER